MGQYLFSILFPRGVNITANTAIVWEPLPTCSIFTTCQDCKNGEGVADLCLWCPRLAACSSGFDRLRPQWEEAGCHQEPLGPCLVESEGEKFSGEPQTNI